MEQVLTTPYGEYEKLLSDHYMIIDTRNINKDNYEYHFNSILNILRDNIERLEDEPYKINVLLADGESIVFSIPDYWINLIFWAMPIFLDEPIYTKYLVDTRAITKKTIKSYYNKLIKKFATSVDFIKLNNLIDDSLYRMKYIDEFAMYLANTVSFHDTLDLMKADPEFNKTIHADLANVPIEEVKNVGMKYAQYQIDAIKNSDHCLRDTFISQEATNPKQYKEVAVNIGTKPDGRGSVFPYIINNSFINGGVSEPESYLIDSSVGRVAQILQKMNVGTSGSFARLLEINNLDTFFNPDPDYDCHTENFIEVYIKDASWLSMYDSRYYRFKPNGPEYLIDADTDFHLIGQTIYVRSPITCASYARGLGICRKCYGNKMYHINKDINPGKLAAELLSSIYTQMLLSAKHLLESAVVEMNWTEGFFDIFEVNLNMISIQEDEDFNGYYIVLDSNRFMNDEDDEDESGLQYDEYTPSFDIIYPNGARITMHTFEEDNLYITEDLNRLMRSRKATEEEGVYTIPLEALKSIPVIFTVKIQNKELQRTLERSKHIINRDKDTSSFTKDTIIREFITTNTEGNINLQAVHLETIIANQMRDPDNILEMPHWEVPNAPYKILTLGSSLTNSPSITVTLEYQKIAKALVNPFTMNKKKPSVLDLYFMEQPQEFVEDKSMISNEYQMKEDNEDGSLRDAIYYIEKDKDDPYQMR